MEVINTEIPEIKIIKPRLFSDPRGYFFESFSQRDFCQAIGREIQFLQDNESRSCKGVIRGLHFQAPPMAQSKLVRCVVGKVLDIAVDIRIGSPTYGKHVAVELSEDNHLQFFIPQGFAHGFSVLSDIAVFQYKCDNYYSKGHEGGINLFDPELNIDWQTPAREAILSEKDLNHANLNNFNSPFIYGKF